MKQWSIIVLILCWLAWRLAVPVDLIKSDLGRHIKNGELILQGQWDVLYKNYYSYTNPEYPFINHHWLFGIFCYVLWHFFGFNGLSFIYLILEVFTFYLFFRSWQRYSSFPIACAVGLLSFPLICFRSEIRPEGISYLFCAIFWWLIDSFQEKRLKPPYLIFTLCILQIIWVNTHIFFILGPILTALFWWQARSDAKEEQANVLRNLFFLLCGACFINPSGISGVLAPFQIDKAYFYPIVENYSSFYLFKAGLFTSVLLYFFTILGTLAAALFFLIRRDGFKKYILIVSLTLLLSLAGMKALRMVGLFGYFWIPLSMYVLNRWVEAETAQVRKNIEVALVVLGIIVSVSVNFDWKQNHSLGIVPGSNDAAEFFKREKIAGNIFNNYDIGGYLIYHLSPGRKLFVDDRMEAYPEDFLEKTYVQMQWKDILWHQMEQRYHFNSVFIVPEQSPWGFRFFVDRLEDPSWALVFLSDEAVIFLKRNELNEKLIRRDEIHVDKKISISFPRDFTYK